jgi:hypothetical protein
VGARGHAGDARAGRAHADPADTKYCLRNTGSDTARLLIYVDRAKDVVTFDEPVMPIDTVVVES